MSTSASKTAYFFFFFFKLFSKRLEGVSDPKAAVGRADDHPRVAAALDRTGGERIVKRLFEEFIGRGLHQINQVGAVCVAVFLKETSKKRWTQ